PSTARQSVFDLNLRSIVCVPLRRFHMREGMDATSMLKYDVTGVLYVDSRQSSKAFSKTSLTLLESLAFEASKSLESMRLMQEEQEKQRLEREFNMAREVQVALLPTGFLQPDYFEVSAHSVPCRYVGGDFYDLITLRDGQAIFILADVSGKGISAALLASMAQGVMQAQFDSGFSLTEVVSNLNRVVVQKSEANRFITLFCAQLDREGNLTFVNAGHNPPILARADGRIELLSTKSMMLGAFDFAEYRASQTKLVPGDVLVAFSDGVTEAVNASNEMFGDERLERLVGSSIDLSAEQIKDRILKDVLAFTRGLPQSDDITLLALKMKS
ncbi:MAG TPA: PP2C family protein-serine/threonine phosphatase, partial [Pyrinomonadaceae bacterium]|nr:PP2C family protein-serine/threonine phosphatase [Pyrinomonadaceae bacterium]